MIAVKKYLDSIEERNKYQDLELTSDKKLLDLLYSNIVICVGSSVNDGMAERLQTEMKLLVPEHKEMIKEVIAPSDRKDSEWIGGSILASYCLHLMSDGF